MRKGTAPTIISNQQPQPQDPVPQRERRITRRTSAQGREARDIYDKGSGRGEEGRSSARTIEARWKTGIVVQ